MQFSATEFQRMAIYTLQVQGTLLGFCAIEEVPDACSVEQLWLRREYIGQGYGKQLLNESLQRHMQQYVQQCIQKPMQHAPQHRLPAAGKAITVVTDPHAEVFYSRQSFITVGQVSSTPVGRQLPFMRKMPGG